jgi:Flp pilus assembly protein TadG
MTPAARGTPGSGRRRRSRLGLWRGCAGTTAIEFALLAPVLFMMIIGLAEVALLMWTQVTLDQAASAAARCAAVDSVNCATTANIQAYGAGQAYGLTLPTSDFTVTTNACGRQVDIAYPYRFLTPLVVGGQITMTAHACSPAQF